MKRAVCILSALSVLFVFLSGMVCVAFAYDEEITFQEIPWEIDIKETEKHIKTLYGENVHIEFYPEIQTSAGFFVKDEENRIKTSNAKVSSRTGILAIKEEKVKGMIGLELNGNQNSRL